MPVWDRDKRRDNHPPACICFSCIEERRQRRRRRNVHPASQDAVVVWREAEGSRSTDSAGSESRGGGSGIITDLPESKFKRGAGCVGLIAILIGPFLALWIFSTGYDDIREFIDQFNQPPTPKLVQVIVTATPLPIPAIPATHTPTPTLTPTYVPMATAAPSPTSVPTQVPTATATHIPPPTPRPAVHSIEVVRTELLNNGLVDFVLNVKNEGDLAMEEVAQVEMSVDGGVAELVNTIGTLAPGESQSFAFTRTLTPGQYSLMFMVGDSAATATINISTPTPTVTPTPSPTNTPLPTSTPLPTNTPTPEPTPTPLPPPQLRHIDEKRYMLELINAERENAGLDPVILGDNIAAQLHAEAALENCFTGHWGVDGLKPYMRYSLAGGYQSNGENGLGKRYCIRSIHGFRPIAGIHEEILDGMNSWMESPGHRRNILGRWHKKVNIGLAWDKYNISFYQHFEGNYVDYEHLPTIKDGILSLSGTTKNGALFTGSPASQIYYDPPPHSLTRGQLSRTYCYDSGSQIGALRRPLIGNEYYTEDTFSKVTERCNDPYDVPRNTPAPEPPSPILPSIELPRLSPAPSILFLQWITALELQANGEEFSIRADISDLISEYGDGVYSVKVWGQIGGEDAIISQYSIFHGVTPPDTYNQ